MGRSRKRINIRGENNNNYLILMCGYLIVPEAPEIMIISTYLQDSTNVNEIVTIDCIVKKTVR